MQRITYLKEVENEMFRHSSTHSLTPSAPGMHHAGWREREGGREREREGARGSELEGVKVTALSALAGLRSLAERVVEDRTVGGDMEIDRPTPSHAPPVSTPLRRSL